MRGAKFFHKKLAISMSQSQNISRIYELLVLLRDFQVVDGGDGFPDISNDVGIVGAQNETLGTYEAIGAHKRLLLTISYPAPFSS